MKTLLKLFAIGLLTVVAAYFLSVNALTAPTAPSGWYVRRNACHKQPEIDAVYQYTEDYDCYYVDKRYCDTSEEKVLYLTFDVGYENGNTAKILNILKDEGVKGSFFVLSHLVMDNTDLVLRMANEGHIVCNHTSKHKNMTKIHSFEEFAEEILRLDRIYREKTGKEMAKIYRPPEGRISEENLKFLEKMGYKTVLWSFAYADWDDKKQPSPESAIEKIMSNTHNGAIFLFHPTSETNAKILGQCIQQWKSEGYRFATLDELKK